MRGIDDELDAVHTKHDELPRTIVAAYSLAAAAGDRGKSAGRWFSILSVLTIVTVISSAPIAAQEHDHGPSGAETSKPPEQLGKVHFETSCAPAVAPKFDRAVALLHSFWFPVAIDAFNDVLKADTGCAIAYWGIALSQWGNPFGANNRSPQTLQGGWASVQTGLALAPKTPREREYISAVGELYKNGAATDQRSRVVNYSKAMEDLAAKYTADSEAQIFYALALDGTILPTDKKYTVQIKGRRNSGETIYIAAGPSWRSPLHHSYL